MFNINKMFTLTCFILLCGCISRIDSIEKNGETQAAKAETHLSKIQKNKAVVIQELPEQWVNPVPLNTTSSKISVPPCAIKINRPGVVTLSELSAFINRTCKVAVIVTTDAQNQSQARGKTEKISGQIPIPAPDATGMVPLDRMGGDAAPVVREQSHSSLKGIYWEGGLEGFMDNLTTRLGLSWRYENGHIKIFWLETRNFHIMFMDSKASFGSKTVSGTTSSSSNGNGGMTGDANTSQTTELDIKTDRFADIKSAVTTMLTPSVGRMNLTAGVLTVTDTPQTLKDIEDYINDRNKELTRQVVFNVEVYSVESRNKDQLGIDWNAVFTSGSVQATISNSFVNASKNLMTTGVILDGKGEGSKAFIKALSEQANISVVTNASSLTTNLSAVPIQIAKQQDYVSQVTSEQTANVGTTVTAQKSTITTGFNMTVLPYLMPNSSQMLIQFSINMSDDPVFRTFSLGENSSIELADLELKTFTQQAQMRSGQTLVLSGYEQTSSNVNRQGVGSPRFWGLGGGASGNKGNAKLVILITPVIIG